jgi:hypothetical protein
MTEEIFTTLEPPIPPFHTHDDEMPTIDVHMSIGEADSTTRAAGCTLPANATDMALADALIACLRAVAEMRGPGLATVIEMRVPRR